MFLLVCWRVVRGSKERHSPPFCSPASPLLSPGQPAALPSLLLFLGLGSKLASLPQLPIRGLLTLTYNNTARWASLSDPHTWVQTHRGKYRNPHTDSHKDQAPHTSSPKNNYSLRDQQAGWDLRYIVNACKLMWIIFACVHDQTSVCVCVGMIMCWGLHMGSQIYTGSYVFLPSERDRECNPEYMLCFNWANTLCFGSCIFDIQTDTRENKHHSLLTYVRLHFVPPVSFYLKGLMPKLLPLLYLTSKLLSFGMCTPNYI